MPRIINNPDQYILLTLFGVSEMPFAATLVYHPPTFDCPEEGSYELVYDRAYSLMDQEIPGSFEGMQRWMMAEFMETCFN